MKKIRHKIINLHTIVQWLSCGKFFQTFNCIDEFRYIYENSIEK